MNYFVAAAALRAISAHFTLRKAYRLVGNHKRSRPIWIPKSRWVWEQVVKEGVDSKGHILLELGTGWVHAGSLYSALLIDAPITAFDVWDNRSLHCTKNEIVRVEKVIQEASDHSESDKKRARERAEAAIQAKTFSELYDILNCSIDMIYSIDVLEHVYRDDFISLLHIYKNILRPSGRFVASVGLDDHTAHYDRKKSMKEYLYHSNMIWDYLLSNRLQYINRLTASEMVGLFQKNGFEVENFEVERCEIDLAAVHPYYTWQTRDDMEATCLRLYARASP